MARPALQGVGTFGAAHVAAAVADGQDTLETFGEIERVFPLASVTKPLVAYATLVAVEEGTVSLEDALGPPGATLAHLLAHASGLSPEDPTLILAEPGTRRIYSSAAYGLVAEHLEARSGFSMAQYLHEAVLAPLGMDDTALVGHAGAGAVSSVADLVRFARELLQPSLLSRPMHQLATTVAFAGLSGVLPGFGRQRSCDFGLGFEVRDHKQPHWTGEGNDPATYGHFGQSGTFVWVDPSARISLVVLTDRAFGPWAAAVWPPLSDAVLDAYRR